MLPDQVCLLQFLLSLRPLDRSITPLEHTGSRLHCDARWDVPRSKEGVYRCGH